jgi:hypothetical protein
VHCPSLRVILSGTAVGLFDGYNAIYIGSIRVARTRSYNSITDSILMFRNTQNLIIVFASSFTSYSSLTSCPSLTFLTFLLSTFPIIFFLFHFRPHLSAPFEHFSQLSKMYYSGSTIAPNHVSIHFYVLYAYSSCWP